MIQSCISVELQPAALAQNEWDEGTSSDSEEGPDTIKMYLQESSDSSSGEESNSNSSQGSVAGSSDASWEIGSSSGEDMDPEHPARPGGDGDPDSDDDSDGEDPGHGDGDGDPDNSDDPDHGGDPGHGDPDNGGDPHHGGGLGHGEDPDDPDGDPNGEPDGDPNGDNDEGGSDSDPDGDMPAGADTFSFDNPILDAQLVINDDAKTKRELLAMIIALSVRSRLDYETTTKLFSIINLSLGRHQMPQTKKQMWAYIRRNWLGIKKHAYCSHCHHYFGIRDTLGRMVECPTCGKVTRRGNLSYFITLNVRNQLVCLLTEPGAWGRLQYPQRRNKANADAIEDILDGEAYRRIPKGQYDFTYQFNLDPFSTSKSSKTEVCPIFMKVNEYPPNLRQKNVILAALWLGPKDVDFNLFMKVFRKQANKLSEIGIAWRPDPQGEEQVSRFYPTCGVCDAVGRAGVLNLHTHAGSHSCPYCEHPGVKLEGAMKFPTPGTVVQRVRRVRGREVLQEVVIPGEIDLRTDASVRRAMAEQNPRQTGFKGPAEVALINHFDLAIGFVTDDLHPIYIGVTQFHTELLLAGIPGVYEISKRQKKAISRRLKAIKTPTHISRKTRGIDTMAKWKGTEWRNWLLFFAIPCLDGFVPARYLRHLGLLSEAIFILSRDSITEQDLAEADRLLTEYVRLFQEYFGPENMRYNIHILTHLVQCVRLWGPLWAISTMPYESWNYRLRKCVSSPKGALDQITMRYLMVVLVKGIPFNLNISDEVKALVKFMQDGPPKEYTEVDGAYFFGEPANRAPTNAELQLLAGEGYACANLTVYPQVLIRSFECRSAAYRADIKSLNSLIYTHDDSFQVVEKIVVFQHGEALVGGLFTSEIEVNHEEPLYGVAHIVPVLNDNERSFIRIRNVRNLAIKMDINETSYMTPMSNQLEID